MVFIAFRAFGPDFSAADFATSHGLKGHSLWQKGAPDLRGRPYENSGLTISLPEASSSAEAARIIETFVKSSQQWLRALDKQAVTRTVDLGVTVGGRVSFFAWVEFDPAFLKLLSEFQITLCVTAYPTSDD